MLLMLLLLFFSPQVLSSKATFEGFRNSLLDQISGTHSADTLLDTLTSSLASLRDQFDLPEKDSATCTPVTESKPIDENAVLVQINDFVYDLSNFQHPGGDLGLEGGEDITTRFLAAHQGDISLLEREDVRFAPPLQVEIAGKFYDLTRFAPRHPGGPLSLKPGENLTDRYHRAHGRSYARLQRKDVREVDPAVEASRVPKQPSTEPRYGGTGGVWREWVGRRSWFLIHSIAAKYPDNPSEDDQQAMRNFVAALGQLYPCKLCRKHLQQQLRDPVLGPVRVQSRTNLTTWMCELHNIVNKDIGKPQFDCTPFHLDLVYLKDCGECEHTASAPVDPKTQSGYHPTSGTWDAALYSQNPALLQVLADPAGVWEARALDELIAALMTLNSWFGVFDEEELRGIRSDLSSAESRRKWTGHFNSQLRPLLKSLVPDERED